MENLVIKSPSKHDETQPFVDLMRLAFEVRSDSKQQDSEDSPAVLPDHMFTAFNRTDCLRGAYLADKLVGFEYWWPDPTQENALYLHAMGVDPAKQGRSIGEALLKHLREWSINHGFDHIHWTFNPLKGDLAHLYIHKVGGVVQKYQADMYGELDTAATAGRAPSDRLITEWDLESVHVEDCLSNKRKRSDPQKTVIKVGSDGKSLNLEDSRIQHTGGRSSARTEWTVEIPNTVDRIGIEIPYNYDEIQETVTEIDWQYALREAFESLLDSGYLVKDFLNKDQSDVERNTYVLTQNAPP